MATYVITGTNRGIGLEFCKQLLEKKHKIIAVCRQPSDELKKLGVQIESGIDVTDAKSVTELAERLQNTPIDVLINNAGILSNESIDNMDFDKIQQQLEVNAVAPLRITHTLLPNLHPGSKVIFITSRMGSIGDNTSGTHYGYRMSKTALNIAAVNLALDLKSREISIGVFHPGVVSTEMTDYYGISPTEAVQNLLLRCDELNLTNSGQFRHANGETLPW